MGCKKSGGGELLSLVYPHVHISATVLSPWQPAFSPDIRFKFAIFHAEEANEIFESFTTDRLKQSRQVQGNLMLYIIRRVHVLCCGS